MRFVATRAAPLDPVVGRVPDDARGWVPYPGAVPDMTDAATCGCVLRLVREAYRDPGMWCEPDGTDLTRWAVYRSGCAFPRRVGDGATEGAALEAALLAAPVLP